MIGRYDYDWYKERVTIPQVLMALGYKWNRSAGKVTPEFVLERNGQVVDKLLVFHPTKKYATVSHREEKGVDLIRFIEQNLDQFPEAAGRRNNVDGINRVLAAFANVQHDAGFHLADATAKINGTLDVKGPQKYVEWRPEDAGEKQPFNLSRFERYPGNVERAMGFLAARGISRETVELFSRNFEMTRDTQSQYKYKNLSFPYTKAGTPHNPEKPENIVGYEVRGFGKYKGKVTGTDSKHGCWQAYLGKDMSMAEMPFAITQVHFAESALDIMAYVQLNRHKLDLDHCIFVSVGGTPSVEQLKGVINTYSAALPVLHFDNDQNGIAYDCHTAAVMLGKSFSITHNKDKQNPKLNIMLGEKSFTVDEDTFSYNTFRKASGIQNVELKIEKAPGEFKDWNDVLIASMNKGENMQRKMANAVMHEKFENAAQKTAPETQETDNDKNPQRGRRI